MSVNISNRDVDVRIPSEFIQGMDIEVTPLEDELIAFQHRQRYDSEFWNLKWSTNGIESSDSVNNEELDSDFEDVLYNSVRALEIDDSLEEGFSMKLDDGEKTITYNTQFTNISDGTHFQMIGGDMIEGLVKRNDNTWVDRGEIEYLEIDLEDRKYIWEKKNGENMYGILGESPVRSGDISLFENSWPFEKRAYMDTENLKQTLQQETLEYNRMAE